MMDVAVEAAAAVVAVAVVCAVAHRGWSCPVVVVADALPEVACHRNDRTSLSSVQAGTTTSVV